MRWPVWRVAVAERSMEPALMPGDWLLAWRGWRGHPRVRPGLVVVARHPERPGLLLVKRVAWREPAGWWLDSDNRRAGSVDSSRLGPVRTELIEARVLTRYWPLIRRRQRGSGPGGPEPRTCG
jgi:nickel-type superoxide dismutase maturation protease